MNTTPIFASTVFDRAAVEAQEAVMKAAQKAQEVAQEALRKTNEPQSLYVNPYAPFEITPKGIGEKLNIKDTGITPENAEEFKIFIIG